MDKRILKNIAKEWAKAILLACDMDAIIDSVKDGLVDEDEASYIVEETHEIAERITKEPNLPSLTEIVDKYYKLE